MLDWLSRRVVFPLWEASHGGRRRHYLEELSHEQWEDLPTLRQRQFKRLRDMVEYARRNCPYYQQSFQVVGRDGPLRDWAAFRALPMVGKQQVRTDGARMLSRQYAPAELVEARTGGSTGTSLTIYADKACQQQRNASAMLTDSWAGRELGMKIAAIWGNPPVPRGLKDRLRNLLIERCIYLDTMDMSEESCREFIAAWRRERPRVLFGHSHSLYILATFLRRLGVDDLRPRGIISTSMQLLAPERQVIEAIFACSVTNRYGCEEVGLIASECEEHRGLHLNMSQVVVEFLREDGSEAAPGEEAEIVVTDLVNHGMPLIRYRVGDMGIPSARQCACGRGLALMESVTGRRADFLKRPDGSLVAGVSLVERTLTAIPGIEQMQLVQDEPRAVRVRVVRDPAFTEAADRRLRQEFEAAFGPAMTIQVEYVPALDQTAAGKYRFAICNV